MITNNNNIRTNTFIDNYDTTNRITNTTILVTNDNTFFVHSS